MSVPTFDQLWAVALEYLIKFLFLAAFLAAIVIGGSYCYGCRCPFHKAIGRIPSKCIREFCLDKLSSCSNCTSKEQSQSRLFKLYQSLGRFLCLQMFPGLFTKHTIRRAPAQDSGDSSSDVFILLLNRNIKERSRIMPSFSVMSFMIFAASAMAIFTYVPLVIIGPECLEKDSNGRPLFCYTNESNNSVNCSLLSQSEANFSNGAMFICKAWTLDIFGVAFAAAMTIFKLAIVITTAYVRIGEWCLKASKCKKSIATTLKVIISVLLVVIIIASFGIHVVNSIVIPIGAAGIINDSVRHILTVTHKYSGYLFMPFFVCLGLVCITWNLQAHCEQMEYNTLSPDQEPPPAESPPTGELPAPNCFKSADVGLLEWLRQFSVCKKITQIFTR